ncbi:MAG: TMEM43 family protein [Dokdonella sp.]
MHAFKGRAIASFIVIAVIALAIALAWWRHSLEPGVEDRSKPVIDAAKDIVDPANEGRLVRISGGLVVDGGALDQELGIASDAAVLLRSVEMYQWQEQCIADACGQNGAWSSQRIDASRFREQAGRENPGELPFKNARFDAREVRLGVHVVDVRLLDQAESIVRPVYVRELHPNLAAIFRDDSGVLYSGEDPGAPAIGDLRVSYRIVPAAQMTLVGVQNGDRLIADNTTRND